MAKKMSTGAKVGIGAGVAALAVGGAAATYLLAGKDAAKHRAHAKKFYTKAKSSVKSAVKKVNKLDHAAYKAVVGEVLKGYKAMKNVHAEDVAHLGQELHASWNKMEKEVNRAVPKAKSAAKKGVKVVKKAVKSVAKKVSPKKRR